ncbi:DUF192 domain-containing protein [Candidatus Kaiserbacteria bacterium]|nr:DUF192 domain-containing protein [Candidatus Kaiserbacteria bacterium]
MIRLKTLLIFVAVIVGVWFTYEQTVGKPLGTFFSVPTHTMRVGNVPMRVEIAQTEAERIQGLSDRESLGEVSGLFFVFPQADYHGVWMKDMEFAIDVIWISEDLKVVDISRNLLPQSYPKIFRPSSPAKYAVETEVLFTETFGIKIGDTVVLPRVVGEEI